MERAEVIVVLGVQKNIVDEDEGGDTVSTAFFSLGELLHF